MRSFVLLLSLTLSVVNVFSQTGKSVASKTNAGFTEGNLIVYRVGDGSGLLNNGSTAVFLEEYTPTGTLVQTIALPTQDNGQVLAMTASGSGSSEGMLTRTTNGQYLTFGGYNALPGISSIAGTSSTAVPRILGRVDAAGALTQSLLGPSAFSTGAIRSVASTDGSAIYMAGSTSGIRRVYFGDTASFRINESRTGTISNWRTVNIFHGQLYAGTGSGTSTRLTTIGTGLPNDTGVVVTQLPGFSTTGSPYQFFFADLDPNVPGVDVLYVADDNSNTAVGGIQKYSLSNNSWQYNGVTSLGVSAAVRGLTGYVESGIVTLYASTSNHLYSLIDATGYNNAPSTVYNTLTTAANNTAYRGVALAPIAAHKPQITSFNPATAPAGTTITITGNNFDGATNVSFGGTAAASFTVNSNTTITAVVGNGSSGSVSVTNADGTGSLAGFNFCTPTSSDTTASVCYSFTWKDSTYKRSGNYIYKTTNASGCDSTVTLHLTITSLPYTASSSAAACYATRTGSLHVQPTAGTAPFQYRLGTSGSFSTPTSGYGEFSNLRAGKYYVYFKDNTGCLSLAGPITVTEPAPLTVTGVVTAASCYGLKDGAITLDQPNPVDPNATYALGTTNSYGASREFTNLHSGNYRISYKNGQGCVNSVTFFVPQPQKIIATATPTAETCAGARNGTISINAAGGSGHFLYKLGTAGLFQTSPYYDSLRSGTYRVTVKDSTGCTGPVLTPTINSSATPCSGSRESIESEISTVKPTLIVSISPNPAKGAFRLLLAAKPTDRVQIKVIDLDGKIVYKTAALGSKTIIFGESLAPGIYIVEASQGSEVKTLKAIKVQ